jgi:Coenzyme PQQ synthesis protein D (PqqD)
MLTLSAMSAVTSLSLTPETRISIAKEQVSTELGGEAVILNLKTGVYYGLDQVGSRIWNLLQEPKTLRQLIAVLLAEYEVEPVQLEADVRALLVKLFESDLIEIA